MPPTPEPPFTDADLVGLKEQLDAIEKAEAMVRKARQAGIDIGEQEKELEALKAQVLRIKQTFFPGN